MKKTLFAIVLFLTSLLTYGQVQKAEDYFEKACQMHDNKNYKAAIQNYHKAIDLDHTGDCGTGLNGTAQARLGRAYFENGDTTHALQYFDQSIVLDPSIQNKAAILTAQNRNTEAYQLLDELIKTQPDFIDAYLQRGYLYHSEGKKNLAVADLQKALELNKKQKILPADEMKYIKNMIQDKE